jgi:maleylpyruvate isomerase
MSSVSAADAVPTREIEWLREGTSLLLSRIDQVPEGDFSRPSNLDGWTVGHLVAHVAYNAKAIQRLLRWAATGIETPMYSSTAARNEEIEQGSRLPAAELKAFCHSSAEDLDRAITTLSPTAWHVEVRTAQGRVVPASETVWMRVREVWVHAADIVAVAQPADFTIFPAPLIDALIADVRATFGRRGGSPVVALRASDREASWQLGEPSSLREGESPVTVKGTAAALATWLTGRGVVGLEVEDDARDRTSTVPAIPRWI